jgi:thiamine biosynthesis lipoprotein
MLLHTGCGLSQSKPLRLFHDVHPAMGSEFSIDLYAPDQETAQQWMQLSFDEIDRIEELLSNYRPSSELSRISREAGRHAVTTDPETFTFLQTALNWSRRSEGAFDITVGPLMRAWGFFFNNGRIPQETELAELRKQTGWQNIRLALDTRSIVFINGTNMELDPGGIGKGYAVDRIVALLREQHVTAARISAGSSSIYGLGAPPGAAGWRITVPDPARAGAMLTSIMLKDASLSTSACTEKFFIKDGHRYCHILDPHTMHPVENMLQTTIVAPSATDSDALSTATFVMGADAATRLLESLPHTSAVLVAGTPAKPGYHSVHWPQPLRASQMPQ